MCFSVSDLHKISIEIVRPPSPSECHTWLILCFEFKAIYYVFVWISWHLWIICIGLINIWNVLAKTGNIVFGNLWFSFTSSNDSWAASNNWSDQISGKFSGAFSKSFFQSKFRNHFSNQISNNFFKLFSSAINPWIFQGLQKLSYFNFSLNSNVELHSTDHDWCEKSKDKKCSIFMFK